MLRVEAARLGRVAREGACQRLPPAREHAPCVLVEREPDRDPGLLRFGEFARKLHDDRRVDPRDLLRRLRGELLGLGLDALEDGRNGDRLTVLPLHLE